MSSPAISYVYVTWHLTPCRAIPLTTRITSIITTFRPNSANLQDLGLSNHGFENTSPESAGKYSSLRDNMEKGQRSVESRQDSAVDITDITVCLRIYDSRASALLPYLQWYIPEPPLPTATSTSLLQKYKFKTDLYLKPHTYSLGERRAHTKLAAWHSWEFE